MWRPSTIPMPRNITGLLPFTDLVLKGTKIVRLYSGIYAKLTTDTCTVTLLLYEYPNGKCVVTSWPYSSSTGVSITKFCFVSFCLVLSRSMTSFNNNRRGGLDKPNVRGSCARGRGGAVEGGDRARDVPARLRHELPQHPA